MTATLAASLGFVVASFVSAGLCIPAGAVLLFFAVRGRLVLSAARCGTCGYHVAPGSDPAGACSECGAAFNSPDGVRYGERKARKKMAIFGVVVIVLGVALPLVFGLAESMTKTGAAGITAPKTWLLPIKETPDMMEHPMWALENVPTSELLQGLTLRPFDEGIWWAISSRAKAGELSKTEAIEGLELATSIHAIHDLDPNNPIGSATRSIASAAFEVLDPEAVSDLAILEAFVGTAIPISPNRLERANRSSTLFLTGFRLLPADWDFEIESVDVLLDETPLVTTRRRRNYWRTTIPSIPSADTYEPHTLTVSAAVALKRQSNDGETAFRVHPTRRVPMTVVRPGATATTYNEQLDPSIPDMLARTTATLWTPEGNDSAQLLSVNFSPQRDSWLAANVEVIPHFEGATLIDGAPAALVFRVNRSTLSASAPLRKTYRLSAPLTTNTVAFDLKPRLEVLPSENARRNGLLGVNVHLRGIPVRNLDDENASPSGQTTVTTSLIEGDSAAPLFGPSPMMEPSAERTEAIQSWLAPRIATWTDRHGVFWAQFQYGLAPAPPVEASLLVSIDNTIEMLDATAGGGAFWIRPAEPFEDPRETARVTFEGLPGCVRRDRPTPFFGGSFTLDVPIEAGTYNPRTRRIEVPTSEAAP